MCDKAFPYDARYFINGTGDDLDVLFFILLLISAEKNISGKKCVTKVVLYCRVRMNKSQLLYFSGIITCLLYEFSSSETPFIACAGLGIAGVIVVWLTVSEPKQVMR